MAISNSIYFKEKLTVGNSDSPVAICTLWTPKEKLLDSLSSDSYFFGGQLYSPRGLNFVVRNLLTYPKIQYLILCGKDLSGAGQVLVDFFTGKDIPEGSIDKEVPKEARELLIETVELIDLRGEEDTGKLEEMISSLDLSKTSTREPMRYPQPERDSESFPTDFSVFKVRDDFVGEVWLLALKNILKFGLSMQRIGGHQVLAVNNLAAVIEKEDPKEPTIYPFFDFDQEGVQHYWENFSDPQLQGHSYSYGERLKNYCGINQVEIMKEKLARFPAEEGALAVLWNVEEDNFPPDDGGQTPAGKQEGWNVPCLDLVQAQCFANQLYLTAYFRANDIFGAWPRNVFALRRLQGELAESVGKGIGSLVIVSQFAWISESVGARVEEILDKYYQPRCVWDPRGNFLISVKGEQILATHLSPQGIELQKFSINGKTKKAAVKLCQEIIGELAISDLNHAADLGRELAKAETAVKNGLKYIQDQPLDF
ncbi:MAG: DUF4346 domain-containing protein [Patescibacteria group bacterium]